MLEVKLGPARLLRDALDVGTIEDQEARDAHAREIAHVVFHRSWKTCWGPAGNDCQLETLGVWGVRDGGDSAL